MVLSREITARIREVLEKHPEGTQHHGSCQVRGYQPEYGGAVS